MSFDKILRDRAFSFGEVRLSGRRVMWYQLATLVEFALLDDARTTTQILRDAIATEARPSQAESLFMQINGIASGMLSRQGRAQNESQALSVLEQRFRNDPEFQKMVGNPDFQLYLHRKAAQRIAKLRGES
jgi:hypothetical protein